MHLPGLFLRVHRKSDAESGSRGPSLGGILYPSASRAEIDPPQVNPEPAVQA